MTNLDATNQIGPGVRSPLGRPDSGKEQRRSDPRDQVAAGEPPSRPPIIWSARATTYVVTRGEAELAVSIGTITNRIKLRRRLLTP